MSSNDDRLLQGRTLGSTFKRPQDHVTVPEGAGPGTPRIIFGGGVPAELVALGIDRLMWRVYGTGVQYLYRGVATLGGNDNIMEGLGDGSTAILVDQNDVNFLGIGTRNYRLGSVKFNNTLTLVDFNDVPVTSSRMGIRAKQEKTKLTDRSRNNTTVLSNDNNLANLILDANARYRFTMEGVLEATAVANFKLNFSVPALTTASMCGWTSNTGAFIATDPTASPVFTGAGAGVPVFFSLTGWIVTGANSGVLNVQTAQSVAEVSNAILRSGTGISLFREA